MKLPKMLIFLPAVLAASALLATSAVAQLAKKELLPEGQLFLPPGNFSPIEEKLRFYGRFLLATGDMSFTDGVNFDLDAIGIAAALDFKANPAIGSVGYSTITTTLSTTISGVGIEEEFKTTNLGARISVLFGDSGVFAFEVFKVDNTTTVTGSSGGFSVSDSADTSFMDISVGGGADVSDHLRVAAALSPEVSDQAQFTGFLAGSEIRDGHGTQTAIGLGYNTPDFALGLDFSQEAESQDALAPAERAISATGEVLLGEISLTGAFTFFQDDILRVNGSLASPKSEGTSILVAAKFRVASGVLRFSVTRFDEDAFDTGISSEDADRFDSQTITIFAGRFAFDF